MPLRDGVYVNEKDIIPPGELLAEMLGGRNTTMFKVVDGVSRVG
eukprot:SAG31_NODE_11477_length_1026_cov_0.806904_1_plen_44_part_00